MGRRKSKYIVERNKYRELKYFCLQYNDKIKELKNTEDEKLKEKLAYEINLIVQSAIESEEVLAEYIIENVTNNIRYEYLNVPCCRNTFYTYRKKFFYILAKKR